MNKIRDFLWKRLGVTLDRETWIVGSIVLGSFLTAVVCAILFVITHASFFLLLTVLGASGAGLFAFGGSYNAMSWALGSEEERRKIEEEIALKQWRRRARDPHFKP